MKDHIIKEPIATMDDAPNHVEIVNHKAPDNTKALPNVVLMDDMVQDVKIVNHKAPENAQALPNVILMDGVEERIASLRKPAKVDTNKLKNS